MIPTPAPITTARIILDLIARDGCDIDITHDGERFVVKVKDGDGQRWRARATDLYGAAYELATAMGWDWMEG